MSIFTYEAINEDGKTVLSEITAIDDEAAIAALSKKRLIPIKIELKGSSAETIPFGSRNVFESFTAQDKIILVRNLAAMIKSGLSLNEALEILITDANKQAIKKFLLLAQANVQNGQPLSKAFESDSRHFSPLFVGMIKAGEVSGQLGEALEELSRYISKEYQLVKKIKSALAYPVILIITSIGIVALMLIFVLPRLSKTFTQNNIELPFLTQVLVDISHVITYSFWLDLAVIGLAVGAVAYFRKTVAGKKALSYLFSHLPVIKNLAKKIALVRFSRTLGGLIESSLSVSEALQLSSRAIGNIRYERIINDIDIDLKNGIPLSQSLRKSPEFFPKMLISLVGVGEKTGTLGKVLKNFSDFYEDDVDNALKDLTTFLEPMLLLFMGLTVGVISLAILMPVYSMVGTFKY